MVIFIVIGVVGMYLLGICGLFGYIEWVCGKWIGLVGYWGQGVENRGDNGVIYHYIG